MQVRERVHGGRNAWVEAVKGGQWGRTHGGGRDTPKGAGTHGRMGEGVRVKAGGTYSGRAACRGWRHGWTERGGERGGKKRT